MDGIYETTIRGDFGTVRIDALGKRGEKRLICLETRNPTAPASPTWLTAPQAREFAQQLVIAAEHIEAAQKEGQE